MKKILSFLIATQFIGIGVVLIIQSHIGAGGFDALFAHLYYVSGISIGTWNYMIGFILILLSAFLTNEKINVKLLIPLGVSFIVGLSIDMYMIIIPEISVLVLKILGFTFGIVSVSLGAGIMIVFGLPLSPIDLIGYSISKRFNTNMHISKMIAEGSALVLASIISISAGFGLGQISVGTIVIMTTIGKIIDMFIFMLEKVKIKYEVS